MQDFVDLGTADFRAMESADGLADYVFWGADAAKLAGEMGAPELGEGHYGWLDVAVDDIGAKAGPLQALAVERSLQVGLDYRPHCNLNRLNAQIRASQDHTGELRLPAGRVVGCQNRWGDGLFGAARDVDADGRVVRVRMELGTEKRQATMRQVRIRRQGAILTKAILDGEPIRFAERLDPSSAPEDSGWFFSAGVETPEFMADSSNLPVEAVGVLLRDHPGLEAIIDAPVGTLFRHEGEEFVVDG